MRLAWSQAALTELRIGIQDADSNARPLMVTNVWAFVEYPANGEPPPPIPGSGPPDAGTLQDAGSDAGVTPQDAGADAGMLTDGGSGADAGESADGGTSPDGGSGDDAGTPLSDGGFEEADAGSEPDGGRGPARYAVGCACDAEPGGFLLLALLLSLRRATSGGGRQSYQQPRGNAVGLGFAGARLGQAPQPRGFL